MKKYTALWAATCMPLSNAADRKNSHTKELNRWLEDMLRAEEIK